MSKVRFFTELVPTKTLLLELIVIVTVVNKFVINFNLICRTSLLTVCKGLLISYILAI